jgi:2-furoyl-CoA dehydrogenase large subunit
MFNPDRVAHADSLSALPSNSPVGSRMAIMLGGAAAGAARNIKEKLIAIAAHSFECAKEDIEFRDGTAGRSRGLLPAASCSS